MVKTLFKDKYNWYNFIRFFCFVQHIQIHNTKYNIDNNTPTTLIQLQKRNMK